MNDPKKKKPEPSKLIPVIEAVKETINLVGLAGAAALSMATLNPVPLLVGAVVEAAYLLAVPDTSWYRSLLARRQKVLDAVAAMEFRESQKKGILPSLPLALADRYQRLDATRRALERDLPGADGFYTDILAKLDHLLESFLYFAQKDGHFRSYLLNLGGEVRVSKKTQKGNRTKSQADEPGNQDESWVRRLVSDIDLCYLSEITDLQGQLSDSSDPSAVVQKRLEVLQRRSQYVHKIGDTLIHLQQQMCLVEDTFGLISDEIRARSPKEVLTDVEDVVTQTNLMNEVLDQLGSFDSPLTA